MEDNIKKGRPEIYTQEIADAICEQIATTSKSLRTICNSDDMPKVSTVLKWLRENKNDFTAQYARAKEEQADFMIEEMVDIADDGTNDYMTIYKNGEPVEVENKEVTNRSRLRVDTRKWIASKLKPKKYGDKIDVTTQGQKINSIDLSELSTEELLKRHAIVKDIEASKQDTD